MKKETAVAIISILAVLAIVMCILFVNVNGQNKTLTTDVDNKKEEISKLNTTVEDLKTSITEKEGEISTLLEDVTGKGGEIETLKSDVATKLGEIETLQGDVATKLGEIETLQGDVATKAGEIETLQGDVAAKAGEIETLKGDVTTKEGEIETLKGDVADRETQIEQLNTAIAEKDTKIQEWKDKYEQMRQNLKNMAVARDKALKQVKETEKTLAAKENALAALMETTDEADKAKAQMVKDLEDAIAAKDQLAKDLEAANTAKDQLAKDLEAANAAKDELTKKVEELENAAKAEPAAEEKKEEPAEEKPAEEAKAEEPAEEKPAEEAKAEEPAEEKPAEEPTPYRALMTYEEYAAAEKDEEVSVSTFVQATQSWWDNKITVYAQGPDGAYFIYNMECSQENAAKLVPGTPIIVHGFKAEWGGEVEIADATFEFGEGDPFIAEAEDVTDKIGTDELIKEMNKKVAFKGMTIDAIAYKDDKVGEDDIYVTASKDGKTVSFCVEFYLTGADTEVYKAAAALQAGDVVDIEAFLYWYEGANPHVIAVAKAE